MQIFTFTKFELSLSFEKMILQRIAEKVQSNEPLIANSTSEIGSQQATWMVSVQSTLTDEECSSITDGIVEYLTERNLRFCIKRA